MAQPTQTRNIIVKVDSSRSDAELRKVAGALGLLNKEVKNISKSTADLNNFVGAIGGASILGFSVSEITKMADSMINLNSKLNIFLGSQEQANLAFTKLKEIAFSTRSSLEDTATTFSRLYTATQRLELGLDANLELTRFLQNSFRLSGATAAEAAGGTIQFAQALSFGKLSGQELRSVLSQNAVVAGILTKAIAGTGKSLFQFAEEGKFTTKFLLDAFGKSMDDVNSKAEGMATTFENSTTKALNNFTLKITEMNSKLGLNNGFASIVNVASDNVGTLGVGLAFMTGPAIYKGLVTLVGFLGGPLTLAIAATATATTYATGKFIEYSESVQTTEDKVKRLVDEIKRVRQEASISSSNLANTEKENAEIRVKAASRVLEIEKEIAQVKQDNINITSSSFESVTGPLFFSPTPLKNSAEILATANSTNALTAASRKLSDSLNSDGKKGPSKESILQKQIGALNVEFNKGKIGVLEYNERLKVLQQRQLDLKLSDGSITIAKMNKEMRENEIEAYSRLLEDSRISLDAFNEKIKEFKIEELNEKFRLGKISIAEYYTELNRLADPGIYSGIRGGIENYLEGIGNMSTQTSKLVENAFSSLEDAVFESLKGATDSFAKFTQSVLDDMTRIIIRMRIIKPLSEGFGGALDSLFGPDVSTAPASTGGSRFGQVATPYAYGGIVDSPSFFQFGNRKLGVAGEAGPEAILPLKRGADGKMGVAAGAGSNVQINIINNSSSKITSQETTDQSGNRVLEVMVENTVNKGIASGRYDGAMRNSFGISRKGG